MTDAAPPAALDALRRTWGYASFRPGQDEAVAAALGGSDVLAVLPTGGGKSLIYQVPAIVQGGLTLVVSPLVALMTDQVAALARRGVPAASAHSGLSLRQQDQLWTDAEFGRYRVLYLTPERLQTELFRARAPRLPVTLLAVDEAHCISEWGHSFRPAYREIAQARGLLSGPGGEPVPVVAVTATATPEVRRDVIAQLALVDPAVVVRGFDRPNLIWSVLAVEDKARQLADLFGAVPGPGLVYAGTRRGTETWATRLRQLGVSAEPYHAGLGADVRRDVQARWLSDQTRVIVATSAFGMGIDKPDVRAVVHVALPPTLESYYQEAGRAGRDGERAYATIVLGPNDDRLPRSMIASSHPTPDDLQAVYTAAGSLSQLAIGSHPDRPLPLAIPRLANVAGVSTQIARAAVDRIAALGAWALPRLREGSVMLRVESPERLAAQRADASPSFSAFVDALQRALPPRVYGGWESVGLGALAERLGWTDARVRDGVRYLAGRGVVELVDAEDGLVIEWTQPRASRLAVDANELDRSRKHALRRLEDVIAYTQSLGCRRQHLLAYFGEPSPARCGRCDICLGRHRPDVVTPEDEALLQRLLDHAERGDRFDTWLEGADVSPRRRNALIDWLAYEGLLRLVDPLEEAFEVTPKGLRLLKRSRAPHG